MNLSLNGTVLSEKMLENVDGRTTNGRRTDARVIGILLSSPISLRLR